MTFLYTLKIPGIEGDSDIARHEGEILLDRFQQNYEAPSEMDRTQNIGISDIRPAIQCDGITLVKSYDKAVPNLLKVLTEGEEIEEGTIYCFGADTDVFLTIELRRVVVRKIKITLHQDATEVVANLSYGHIHHSYTPDGTRKAIFSYERPLPYA